MNPSPKTQQRLEKLKDLLKGQKHLLIVMQNIPDPDSIAAAMALRQLAHRLGDITCCIAHGGTVGRAENRALIRYLNITLRPFSEIDLNNFDKIAVVDTQPGTGNNSLPNNIIPDIVIDHHPCRKQTRQSPLIDIRKDYGATATILLEYLIEAKIEPDIQLATAMIYAIRSDTQDLGRQARQADIAAIQHLYPIANLRMLSEIQRGRVQRDYYQMLAAGLQNASVYDTCIIASLGDINIPDMIGEVADLLLRDDQAQWTLCYGYFQGKMLLSLRTSQTQISAEKIMHSLTARRGTGGGHAAMAGGQIPLKNHSATKRTKLEHHITTRLLNLLNIADSNVKPLLNP